MYGISLYVQYKTVLVQCVDGKTLPSKDLFTCSKSTREALGKVVKYVQSVQSRQQNNVIDVVLVLLLLPVNIFHNFF